MKKSMLVAASLCAMLAAVSVGGCGSNNTSGSGNNQPKQEQKAPKGKEVTMDKFNQIQTGMSYDDVKGILGFDGCLSSETKLFNSDQKIFHWHNPKGGFLQISFKDGAVDSKMQSNLK